MATPEGGDQLILATSSVGSVTHDDIQKLAELGFTHIVTAPAMRPSRDFEKMVGRAHVVGMKIIVRFPDWHGLGLCEAPFLFETADGMTNADFPGNGGRVNGCSYWNMDGDVRALESLPPWVGAGIDGILASGINCDRPMVNDWYPFGPEMVKYTTAFWCHDPNAKKAWSEISDEPMPAQALFGHDGRALFSDQFYRFYQNGWLDRITRLADAGLAAGLRDIWTWCVPLDFPDAENAASATYSSIIPMEHWRHHVISAGGFPVQVCACLGGLWDRWRIPGLEIMHQATTHLQWDAIAGPEAFGPECLSNVLTNGRLYRDNGFQGLFCSTGEILQRFDEAKKTFAQIHEMYGG
jgi:hypothetical protein